MTTVSPPPNPSAGMLETDWRRLDPWMLAVTPLRQLFGFLPLIAVVLVVGARNLDGRVYGLLAAVAAVIAAGMLRWLTTRYRITGERVELNSGLLFRTARSVPRDRIRSVDLTAGPVHRLFRLTIVKIGTGEHTEGTESRELTLDAVSANEADRLRHHLLNRPGTGAPDGTGDPEGADGLGGVDSAPATSELATLNWSWLRFAPLTVSSLAAVGGVAGAFAQFIGELGVNPSDVLEISGIGARPGTAALWLGITAFALAMLAIAVLGALLIFVEAWWGFRLTREPGGTLRIGRGLLTTRSVSLEERRLRGAEVAEPLLLRLGHGARLTAVATGLGGGAGHSRGALLPPAPVDESHRVAGLVLAEHPVPTLATLHRHPPAALRRRLVRAVVPVLLGSAVLTLAPVPDWLGWAVLGLLPVTVLLALDSYRNLGHGLTVRYLLTRHGAGVRRTVALQRNGVIGATVSRSLFQRRLGLITLTVTTAAGNGAYHVIDIGTADGLTLAERAVPGLLGPFLEQRQTEPATASGTPG